MDCSVAAIVSCDRIGVVERVRRVRGRGRIIALTPFGLLGQGGAAGAAGERGQGQSHQKMAAGQGIGTHMSFTMVVLSRHAALHRRQMTVSVIG